MVEFERIVNSPATPDQLKSALEAAARPFAGTVAKLRAGGFRVSAGTWLATNPNAVLWSLRVEQREGSIRVAVEPSIFGWTRGRMARLCAVRLRQFVDRLDAALAGRDPAPLAPHEESPFAFGDGPSGACFAFAGTVASATASIACVYAAVWLVAMQVIQRQIFELAGRAEALDRIGYPAVPSFAEIEGLGVAGRLAAAAWFAMPIAFFMGLTHALVHAIGDLWRPAARLAPWGALFLTLIGLFAFVPALPWFAAVPCAILIPFAAQVGTSLVWARRTELVRDGTPPARRSTVRVVAALLAIACAAMLVPTLRGNQQRLDTTALFRDRFLSTNAAGRAVARSYYRYTPYAAEPLKELYGTSDEAYTRTVRTCLMIGYEKFTAARLRRAGFTLEFAAPSAWSKATRADADDEIKRLIARRQHDLYVFLPPYDDAGIPLNEANVLPRTMYVGALDHPRLVCVTPACDDPTWEGALLAVTNRSFTGSGLRDLTGMGWKFVFYGGALFAFVMAAGFLCVPAAFLYRKLPQRTATGLVAAVLALSLAGIAWGIRDAPADELRAIRAGTTDALHAGLSSAHADVRHEAAYRICRSFDDPKTPRARFTAALLTAMRDPEIRVRLWACAAAGMTGDSSVRDPLIAALSDPEHLVRYRAAEGLGALEDRARRPGRPPDPAVVAALVKYVRASTWYEQSYAIRALRQIDPDLW